MDEEKSIRGFHADGFNYVRPIC